MKDRYDVIIGIPSYNESGTIGYVTQMVGQGLAKYFPDLDSIIVNCDNNSLDGTKEAFLSADTPDSVDKLYISTPEGVTGKGNNFWNLFNFCKKVKARIIMSVDADLRSITPEWVKYLGFPVREGYDYVAPLYSRHQFDGTITNHLCYPLVFSLTGLDVRQPIGGEFAFSPKLCSHLLAQDWNGMARQYGIDIFLSLHALFGDFKICQTGLGTKIHKASSPKLGRMFEEVVYTLFSLLVKYRSKWLDDFLQEESKTSWQPEIHSIDKFGLEKMSEAQALSIDILKLKQDCRKEYGTYQDLEKWYLSSFAYRRVDEMFTMDHYDVDIMLWSQIVYKFLYLFDDASEKVKKEIINALKPLYFARSITFDYVARRYTVEFAEEEIKNQAMAFLSQKPYLFGLYMTAGKCIIL